MNDNMLVVNSNGSTDHDIQVVVEKGGSDLDHRGTKSILYIHGSKHEWHVHPGHRSEFICTPQLRPRWAPSQLGPRLGQTPSSIERHFVLPPIPYAVHSFLLSPFPFSIFHCRSFPLVTTLSTFPRYIFYLLVAPICCDLGVDIVLLDEIGVGKVVGRVTSGSGSEGGSGSGSAGGGALRLDLVRAMVG